MATITIYVSRELHEQLKTHRLPVSEICQRALWTELQAGGRKQIIRPTRTRRPAAIQEAQ